MASTLVSGDEAVMVGLCCANYGPLVVLWKQCVHMYLKRWWKAFRFDNKMLIDLEALHSVLLHVVSGLHSLGMQKGTPTRLSPSYK